MAKVRVRALERGYDGSVRREPGDEFDFDVELKGMGRWFEIINAPDRQHKEEPAKPAAKKRSRKKASKKRRVSDDDLLA